MLGPASVAAGLDRRGEGAGVRAVDHQDEHPARPFGRVGDLDVEDAHVESALGERLQGGLMAQGYRPSLRPLE